MGVHTPSRAFHVLALAEFVIWTAVGVTQRLVHNAHVRLKTANRLVLFS